MFVYFVYYRVINGSKPAEGNFEITRSDEIDSYAKVSEIEQAISDYVRPRGIDGGVIVSNWILLRQDDER